MKILFRTRKLEKEYEDARKAVAAYGDQAGRRYIQRINIIKAAGNIEELQNLPGLRCKELKGNLAGKWSMRLTGFYRLIFSVEGERLEIVCIEEVSKHYGD